jgi:hypothetical protein
MTRTHRSGQSQLLSWKGVLALIAVATVLIAYQGLQTRQAVSIATGRPTPAQLEFFLSAAKRPDVALFFRDLGLENRLKMARNIRAHSDSRLAELSAVLLDTFDTGARVELERSLADIARFDADAVANQIERPGEFRRVALFRALQDAGPPAIRAVVRRLGDPAASEAAAAWLSELGEPAVPSLLEALRRGPLQARLSAAEVLGGMRAISSGREIRALYGSANGFEKRTYFFAICSLGAPEDSELLSRVFADVTAPMDERAAAAVGMAHTELPKAIAVLWRVARTIGHPLQEACMGALPMANAEAVRQGGVPDDVSLSVAAAIPGNDADAYLRAALRSGDRQTSTAAIRASRGRMSLAADLENLVRNAPTVDGGRLIADACGVMATTTSGRAALGRLASDGRAAGYAKRALALQTQQRAD